MRLIIMSLVVPAVAVVGTAPTSASAQDQWRAQIREYLDQVADPIQEDGYAATGEELTGSLDADDSEGKMIELQGGRDYALIGVCDNDCSDIDLELYDAAGHEIDSDLEYDDVPIVVVSPEQTATYRVVVGMITCTNEPCYYGVGVFDRPAEEPSEYHQLVRRQLDSFDEQMREKGYQRTHGFRVSALDEGENYEFMVRLKAGTTYGIAAFCDQDCGDLDLAIFGEDDQPVAQDIEADDYPALDVDVTGTGVFKIRVSMAECSEEPCVYGVALHGKPTGT